MSVEENTEKGRGRRAASVPDLTVRKTAKLFVGGALVRSESGRTTTVAGPDAMPVEVPVASRKDVRDAVRAAATAQARWAAMDPLLRGQVLYRIAEMAQARHDELDRAGEVGAGEAMVEAFVHYAGWCDKLGAVLGSVADVAGPFCVSTGVRPLGVVGVVLDDGGDDSTDSLGGSLATAVAAALAAGNAVIAVVSPADALVGLTLAEICMHADVPPGLVSVVTGADRAVVETLASHRAVAGLDLVGTDPDQVVALALGAVDSLTRLRRPGASDDPLARLAWQVERQTVWEPRAL